MKNHVTNGLTMKNEEKRRIQHETYGGYGGFTMKHMEET